MFCFISSLFPFTPISCSSDLSSFPVHFFCLLSLSDSWSTLLHPLNELNHTPEHVWCLQEQSDTVSTSKVSKPNMAGEWLSGGVEQWDFTFISAACSQGAETLPDVFGRRFLCEQISRLNERHRQRSQSLKQDDHKSRGRNFNNGGTSWGETLGIGKKLQASLWCYSGSGTNCCFCHFPDAYINRRVRCCQKLLTPRCPLVDVFA